MATTTVYASTNDRCIYSLSTDYAAARIGTGILTLGETSSDELLGGQYYTGGTYGCVEVFLDFDTSAIDVNDRITQVDLVMYLYADRSDTDFVLRAHPHAFTPPAGEGDWVPGDQLASLPVLATLNTAGIGSSGELKTFTENGDLLREAINKGGLTTIMLSSSRHQAGDTPSGDEFLDFDAADNGTGTAPRLVITHQTANLPALQQYYRQMRG